MPETKYIFLLYLGYRHAVVINWTLKDAKMQACIRDSNLDWMNAKYSIICNVRHTKTSMVLAMDGKETNDIPS